MLHGVFQTKEGKVIIAIMGIAVIIASIFALANYSQNKKFLEQAVMAENYLNAGSYEESVEAYQKALSMKNNDEERLTIGLADAYAGMKEYDKALEVLRASYKKTSGHLVKEEIEEIISEKTDYEYLQSVSRAKVYFNNKEYNKSITEYEKAKQIKSKDTIAYKGIVDSYIELGDYEKAKKEVLEGIEITKDNNLDLTLAVVESYINRKQYNTLVKQASEYIYQENYTDGIAKFQEAIELMPEESEAYTKLAQTYIIEKEYEKAIQLLQNAVLLVESRELHSLLSKAHEYKEQEDKINSLLHNLYIALKDRDITEVTDIINLKLYIKEIASEAPVTYTNGAGAASGEPVMIIYDSNNVYLGGISQEKRSGAGIYLRETKENSESGLYYYDGDWKNDVPNGTGKTVEVNILTDAKGNKYSSKVITEGSFLNAKENGRMMKYFYTSDVETGKLAYTAVNGVPKPMATGNLLTPTPKVASYVIGIMMMDGIRNGKYYRVEPQTVWGVKPFIN